MPADADLERAGRRLASKRAAIDVGDQVAEAIDAQHLAANRRRLDHAAAAARAASDRTRAAAERAEVDPLRQPGGRRREPIASFERPADGRRAYRRSVSSTTRFGGCSSRTSVSTPLSGATNR